MQSTIRESFERSFRLYRDLVESLDEAALKAKLPRVRSNTIGLQFWCVVGARESYARAISADQWIGFDCSLTTTSEKASVRRAILSSQQEVTQVIGDIDSCSDTQYRLVVDLLEHEVAHQGQLIRYLYGLELAIPESWRVRYALQ